MVSSEILQNMICLLYLLTGIVVCLITVAVVYLYYNKKASADGRLHPSSN